MKKRKKDYYKFNKNILLSFAASIIISAIVAQLLAEQQDYLNTTYTLLADYGIFFLVFGILHYLDNRTKYRLESGGRDTFTLKKDLLKIITSLGIAEIVYTIVRWLMQYYLLTLEYDPYLASLISQGISTVTYMIVVNVSAIMTRLYEDAK